MTKQLSIKIFFWLILMVGAPLAGAVENQLHLESYKGKVVYLDFWASWCGPCRKSFPWMNAIYQASQQNGLVVIAVNLDQEHSLAEKFIQEFNPDFNIVFDPEGKLASQFQVMGMPSAVIIGRDGTIRFKHAGFHESKREQYEQELKQLLAEPVP